MSAELDDIVMTLERDRDVWKKIVALAGSRFRVRCCCNSEKCQRIRVEQESGGGGGFAEQELHGSAPNQMPNEVKQILQVCRTNPALIAQVEAYNRSRFDLVFRCAGRAYVDWSIGDS